MHVNTERSTRRVQQRSDLLASGFTPHSEEARSADELRHQLSDKDIEIGKLQAKLNGFQVLLTLMREKTEECSRWKERALVAEERLVSGSRSRSGQARSEGDVMRHNAAEAATFDDPFELRSAQLPEKNEQQQHATAPASEGGDVHASCTAEIQLLKLQVATYCEDFRTERGDREKLATVNERLRRDLELVTEEKAITHRQMRSFEEELHALRNDNRSLLSRLHELTANGLTNQTATSQMTNPAPTISRTLAAGNPAVWACRQCSFDNPTQRNFCEMCGYLKT